MSAEHSKNRPPRWRKFVNLLVPNIRAKIIIPYLLLTLVVASIGTYVVTSLVASSLDERLTNQLLEAGRVVSDSLARREIIHIRAAQAAAFTRGLAEALLARDRETVTRLAQPVAIVHEIESLTIIDADGRDVFQTLKKPDGTLQAVKSPYDTGSLTIVQALLLSNDPNAVPRRGIGVFPSNQRYYYLTALPISLEGRVVGAVVIGTSLDTLLLNLKTTAVADVIIYLEGGRVVGATFASRDDSEGLAESLSISPSQYSAALDNAETTRGENTRINNRSYRLARAPVRVGRDKLGVFAVALPTNFILSAGTASRNTYAVIFTVAAACVVLIGYWIAQRITRPINRLVRTSNAVAEGDLTQRTGIQSTDEIGKLAFTFDEMTERLEDRTRELEKLLQDYKEAAGRMAAILSSIRDGVMLEETNGNFTPLNSAAHAVLQKLSEGFLTSPLREIAGEQHDHPLGSAGLELVESRRFQLGKQVMSVSSAAVRTDDGQHLGNVIVMRDVTAEVEAEQLKDAFVAHVSHELRTPLTAIKGYSDLLLAGSASFSEQQRSFLQTIRHHTDNLILMISGLLDFSEMEAKGRLGLLRKPISLATLVQDTGREWQTQMADKDLAFRIELPPNDDCTVSADVRRLRWALMNLVRNAWQYTPEGGQVALRLAAHDGHLILDIADTGVGIAPQDQPRLFNRFFHPTNIADGEMRGLGLGLYVTKTIIEAHGGTLSVASTPGVGSTFSIILPALAPEPVSSSNAPSGN
jgi:signal transduction histidine kinase